jgi:hypothetical protein
MKQEMNMNITKAQILDKLASWTQEDWDGVMEVWVESQSDLSMNQFAIQIATQNVMFEMLEEAA